MRLISDRTVRWKKYSRKIFTLVELLIVVAVIAILAGVLLPALQSARKKVYTVSCVSQLKQLGMAIYSYSVDSDGFPPPTVVWDTALMKGNYLTSGKNFTFMGNSASYGDKKLALYKPKSPMICPTISTPSACPPWTAGSAAAEWSRTNYCPSITLASWEEANRNHGWGPSNSAVPRERLSRLVKKSVLLGELWFHSNNGGHYNTTQGMFSGTAKMQENPQAYALLDHGGYATNFLFLEGNVMTRKLPLSIGIFRANFTLKY